MQNVAALREADEELAEAIGQFYADPYGFVMFAYKWGEAELEGFDGPDSWQTGFLKEWGQEIATRGFDGVNPVEPMRFSTASGHGIGKSAMSGFITNFIMSTRPFSKGIVTANTAPQLETKTWAEIAKWTKRCITAHWFRITTGRGAMKIVHKDYPDSWRVDGMSWRENAPEAFAGLHAANSTPWYLFDEASAIPKAIFETAEGGLTDGEPMQFLWGNPTQNSGYFYESHHRMRHRFITRRIDSRTARMPNKKQIEEWIKDYGLSSDFVKVRVLGEFPSQSSNQFISTETVDAAIAREPKPELHDPIIFGVDVARFGNHQSVIKIRKGRDGKSYPAIKLRGLDTMQLASRVAELQKQHLPDAIFIDGGGVGGGVVDRLKQLAIPNVIEVNFAFKSGKREYKNLAAQMWAEMREWMINGGAIENDEDLRTELISREYYFDADNRIMLERKEDLEQRGLASPDNADALALTFAQPVGPRSYGRTEAALAGAPTVVDYDPFDPKVVYGREK